MKPTCKASLNTTELASSAKLNTDENDATIIDQAHSHIYLGSTYLSGRQVRPIKNNYLRMKKQLFLLVACLSLAACNNTNRTEKEQQMIEQSMVPTEGITAFSVYADSIITDMLIINPDSTDTWTTECLKGLKREALMDVLFDALYREKIKAYDFITGAELSPDEVKKIEELPKNNRANISKLQFNEQWLLDTATLTMIKKVHSIIPGYEVKADDGSIKGYRAVLKIVLNDIK